MKTAPLNKTFLKSLVTIRMSEIFPCLACFACFFFGNWDRDKHSSVKGSGEDEIGTNFFKSDINDPF